MGFTDFLLFILLKSNFKILRNKIFDVEKLIKNYLYLLDLDLDIFSGFKFEILNISEQ